MNRVTRNGLIAAAAASGALAVTMPAYADSGADGAAAGSPGLISGNTIQLPVHVPVNVCGNAVNVAGLLNPAVGNSCANESDGGGAGQPGGMHGGAVAHGGGKDSPGVLSGNDVQLPVHVPVNVSGNSVTAVGLGSAAIGNESTNTSGDVPHHPVGPPKPSTPPKAHPRPQAPRHAPQQPVASLAHTGADQTVPAIAGSAALLLGGAVLYRRFRPASVR
ncbi:chaplin family protein [Streptomyces sp. NBC_00996]|uniref:chaplin family protein n=1 Tax=Streptomyces sp. NBC_00996 TaxID=2903710 RepID=UPI0038651E3A